MFKTIAPLSGILSLRFLGLFLVLPILSVYASEMEGSTTFLVGIIVGGYALTQAIFQVPFGAMSDKIGRKVTIFIGLLMFLAGSVVCALSEDIYMLMIGRFLQGAGAIGSVIPAMISDMVPEEKRGKAMAMMGGSIAMSFAIAMVLGPILGAKYGLDILFWITGILAIISMIVLFKSVPTPPRIRHMYNGKSTTVDILKDMNLLGLGITGLLQKGMMTIAFVMIPLILLASPENGGFAWTKADLWKAYVPAMIFGLIAMGPAAVFGEKYNKPRAIFLLSILLFGSSFAIMAYASSDIYFVVGVVTFFIAFNMMEPLLQSLITKFAKIHQKGAALGIANGLAYFGTFLGGSFAGIMLQESNREMLGLSLAGLSFVWLLGTLKMKNPTKNAFLYISTKGFKHKPLKENKIKGIVEWYMNESERKTIVKYTPDIISEEKLKEKLDIKNID
jgi:multidrug resistance protein